jgi:alkanesulfonate monooxygenase SsuD/methylene tetrahydromethanopterin reductase-like flavin-dependent oxidoreductase (luciferase family)
MKLDAGFGVEGGYLRNAGGIARAADTLGFAGLWASETKHDAFLPLAIAADATERIELGTSIAVAFSRSPMEVAQTAWDLQDHSNRRFILGLGTRVWVRYHDDAFSRYSREGWITGARTGGLAREAREKAGENAGAI